MKKNGVKHIRCAPYHPSSNGAAERFIQTFKQSMKASNLDGKSITLSHRLENFLLTYHTSPHATTNATPASLFLGREIRTRFDLLKPDLESTVSAKQSAQAARRDQHAKLRHFTVKENVMVRNFCAGPTWIPGIIFKQLAPIT